MSMLPQTAMRGPDDPTEYDLAVKRLGPTGPAIEAWVRQWCWTRYVPEDVLKAMGLTGIPER